MENTKSKESESIFSNLLNQFVKVAYLDGFALVFMKGILLKADTSFVYVRGDYTEKIIAINQIKKIEVEKR